ncbi:MAG: UDP-N-acetylmuramoyl-tripeptide--D-alanyl-D-alanine ligase [Gemmatimonadaceae bacterium]
MPAFWTLDRIADALSDCCITPPPRGATVFERISTDTRVIEPGDCFVALSGERFDAQDFLDQAVAAGATALVASRAPRLGALNVPVYVVKDTLVALGQLARYRRVAWGKPLIGIAGSNGKTSTKELLSAALGSCYTVHATRGNLNNRVGVPLTLLAITDAADVAVVELGTSLPGEIALLREIARPDIAVVTSIAEEHLEGLGDLAGVLAEESAVFDGVAVAIIPATHPELADTASRSHKVIVAGLESGDMHAESWSIGADGSGTAIVDAVSVHSPLRGVHNLRNLMLALAASRELGVSTADAALGVERLTPPPMRASWERVGRALVINDAYNSNPGSALAALDMLAAAPGDQRVAVLGTMRELGPDSDRCHDDVARAALASPAHIVAGIGDFADSLARIAPMDARVITAPDVDELWAVLAPRLVAEPTILLKASRGVKLERILPLISSWAA